MRALVNRALHGGQDFSYWNRIKFFGKAQLGRDLRAINREAMSWIRGRRGAGSNAHYRATQTAQKFSAQEFLMHSAPLKNETILRTAWAARKWAQAKNQRNL
jgi:hypothetical protein